MNESLLDHLRSLPTTSSKCPKTISGEHIWPRSLKAGAYSINQGDFGDYLSIQDPRSKKEGQENDWVRKLLKRCSPCGLIDDREYRELEKEIFTT